ncbi:MAG: hypothetical protein LBD06_12275, partial [Candidatus Accumulibacter sp.]|nr:hypothetical protein [Accumulibacter sp.]
MLGADEVSPAFPTNSEIDAFIGHWSHAFGLISQDEGSARNVFISYLVAGRSLGLSQGELIDFLGVSTPSILDLA